jgi:hypothetical protein
VILPAASLMSLIYERGYHAVKKKIFIPLLLVIAAALLLCACSAKGNLADKSGKKPNEQASEEQNDSKLEIGNPDPNRKLIYYATYEIATTEFDKSLSALRDLTDKLGGYTESADINSRETVSGYTRERMARMVIRIPAEKLNEFFDGIGDVGSVLNEKLEISDVTLEYIDIQARINSLRLQEERILSLLERADSLEYIFEIEKKLGDVRYEIESYTSRLNKMESLISYSKITLTLTETFSASQIKGQPVSFGERLADEFNRSIDRVWNGIQAFAVWFLGNIVEIVLYLAIIAVIILLLAFMAKRISKSGKKAGSADFRPPEPPSPENDGR